MNRFFRLTAMALFCLVMPLQAWGLERFPRPEFESGYRLPETTTPQPRSDFLEYIDVIVLLAALSLAVYFVLKTRSRRSIFLLTVFSLLYFGFWRLGCVCSIGAIQNVTVTLFDSTFAIPLTVVAFFALPLLFAVFFGRVFCAAVCPLGAIQELVVLKPLRVPRKVSAALSIVPYVYLGLAALLAATGSLFLICRFDPFVAFFRVSGQFYQLALGILFLLAGVFIARPYCRYLCPYAVLLRWLSRLSKWHASITPDECIKCRLCEDSCPYDAIRKPSEKEPEDRTVGAKRLAAMIILVPLLGIAGGVAGYALHNVLAGAHDTVRLADRMVIEQQADVESTLETETFRAGDSSTESLARTAEGIRREFAVGSSLLGVFVGIAVGVKLLGASVYRRREGYEPDRAECLSCGRCFAYCPVEQAKGERQGVRGNIQYPTRNVQ